MDGYTTDGVSDEGFWFCIVGNDKSMYEIITVWQIGHGRLCGLFIVCIAIVFLNGLFHFTSCFVELDEMVYLCAQKDEKVA